MAVAALMFAPQGAGATASTIVSLRDCSSGGGSATVPPATAITIENLGFAQGTYGLINNFLLKQRTTLTISDGINTVYDLTSQWRAPQHVGSFWATSLPNTHTGITLAPRQSIVATFDITFTHPLLIAFPPVGSSGNNGPFRVSEDGPVSCVITAEAP
ncbi:MAG: hypothetical protein ACTHQQ_01065 [Solirubrobacteraceae bacterium]